MVSVATGAGTGESVPMLIRSRHGKDFADRQRRVFLDSRIPQFGDPLGGDRMLGCMTESDGMRDPLWHTVSTRFGDIALPGLLAARLARR